MTTAADVPPAALARLRAVCLALPQAYEEQAWVGTRWCVRRKNFGHVLTITAGWPPAYARAAGTDGTCTVLTFRSSGSELDVLSHAGYPFFRPMWAPGILGIVLGEGTDWTEVAELLTESYCVLAPRRFVELVDRPAG